MFASVDLMGRMGLSKRRSILKLMFGKSFCICDIDDGARAVARIAGPVRTNRVDFMLSAEEVDNQLCRNYAWNVLDNNLQTRMATKIANEKILWGSRAPREWDTNYIIVNFNPRIPISALLTLTVGLRVPVWRYAPCTRSWESNILLMDRRRKVQGWTFTEFNWFITPSNLEIFRTSARPGFACYSSARHFLT